MKPKAILNGSLQVPLSAFHDAAALAACKRATTVRPRGFQNEIPEPIEGFIEAEGVLHLPPAWGVLHATRGDYFSVSGVDHSQCTTGTFVGPSRHTRLPDPKHRLAPAGQAQFAAALAKKLPVSPILLVESYTGSGKTAVFLRQAALMGHRTLIIVPSERLADQWVSAIEKHLGVPREYIGRVQQGQCDYRKPQFVIGIIHSIAQRTYPPGFYQAFGIVCWDEVHTVAARMFSRTLGCFSAKYQVGLTATPKRKDGCAPLFLNYFGTPGVVNRAAALATDCRVVSYRSKKSYGRMPAARLLLALSRDEKRNAFLCGWIKWLYETGRTVLVVSHFVEHCELLMRMCSTYDIPPSVMGQFTGEITEGYRWEFPRPKRVQVGGQYLLYSPRTPLPSQQRVICVRYTPRDAFAVVQIVPKRLKGAKPEWREVPVEDLRELPVKVPSRRKMTLAEHDRVKKTATIIFATYGMFKMAQDVPRLDSGIDATPLGTATQVIGRIRRTGEGKLKPLWLTVNDPGVRICENLLKGRKADYQSSNVNLIYQ